jgi:hypothetical protein
LRTRVRKGSGLKMEMMRKNRRKWDDEGKCRVVMEEG